MAEFNPDLHAFLLENETCMWTEKGEIKFGVHVHFFAIKDFIDILGDHTLDDGGIDCNLNNDRTLYIPLDEHFMNSNYTINYYKHCFESSDLENYKLAIDKFDDVL